MRVYAGTNNTIVLAQDDGTERREIPSNSFQIEVAGNNIGLYNQVTKQFDVKMQDYANILDEQGFSDTSVLTTFTRLSTLINQSSTTSSVQTVASSFNDEIQYSQEVSLNNINNKLEEIIFIIKNIAE